jgi:hypothetical protein
MTKERDTERQCKREIQLKHDPPANSPTDQKLHPQRGSPSNPPRAWTQAPGKIIQKLIPGVGPTVADGVAAAAAAAAEAEAAFRAGAAKS